MKRARGAGEPEAIDLLEEAAHLLRLLPVAVHAAYFTGTVPFVLGALFFVADMTRGAFAARHVAEAALGMTALFAWMKTWQAIAAGQALAFLEQRPPARVGVWRFLGVAARQFRLHAFGLVVLPLAAIAALPFGWAYAYYQNATVLELSTGARLHTASFAQAKLWPGQNHLVLAQLSLFGLFVFLNLGIAIYAVPVLLKSLLGVTVLSAVSGWNPFNTTLLAAAAGLAFLALDPLLKAVYVLRCFYGQAQRTGADLLVQTRNALARAVAGVAVVVGVGFVSIVAVRAAESAELETTPTAPAVEPATTSADPRAVDARQLDAALDRVLDRPEYAWRLPRETIAETGERGVILRFIDSVTGSLGRAARWVMRTTGKIVEWILGRDRDQGGPTGHAGSFAALAGVLHVVLLALAALLVGVLAWLVWRWWERRRAAATPAAAPVVTPLLERDDVTADQLPEDEWLRLARELLARGELRLALRALFLGSLASLGARGLLVLARHKSNRDYERELARRGAQLAGVSAAFAENRRAFERAWYGHEATAPDDVRRFEDRVRHLLGGGA